MSVPFSNSDAERDGWGDDNSEAERGVVLAEIHRAEADNLLFAKRWRQVMAPDREPCDKFEALRRTARAALDDLMEAR
jgi:hypothetical protein